MTASYNASNQQTGVSYDANGNQTGNYGSTHYTVDNRMRSEGYGYYGGAYYGYDPWGKRVMKEMNVDVNDENGDWDPSYEFYFYTITGQRLVTMYCDNGGGNPTPYCAPSVAENAYFGSKLIVSNGVYVVTDRLGSVRADSQGESFAYYPYGEERTSTVDDRAKFGTYLRDWPGQDYAEQRYYNSGSGGFTTVDPGGIKTADSGTPLSWNRYAYTYGDPVNFMDRHGLEEQAPGDGVCDPDLDCNTPECYDASNEFLGQPDPGCPTGGGGDQTTTTTTTPPPPSCQQMLTTAITAFLSGRGSPLAADASEIVQVAQTDNLDPTLIAAIAIAENGQYKNNPFSLGPNGSNTYASLDAAISAEGQQLDKYIYTWKETTVSALWSGNTWEVDPHKKWITLKYPGYCVGQTATQVQGCINTGLNISSFMQSMGKQAGVGGNPNNLGYPCEN